MKNILALLIVLTLVGCSTAPVKVPFPEADNKLMQKPRSLEPITIQDGDHIALSQMMEAVARNYGICKENAVLYVAWQEWYKETKDQYDKAGVVR